MDRKAIETAEKEARLKVEAEEIVNNRIESEALENQVREQVITRLLSKINTFLLLALIRNRHTNSKRTLRKVATISLKCKKNTKRRL